jgi:hypothetical protein
VSYDAPITVDDGFFAGEDKTIRIVVYVDGHGPNDPDPQVENISGWSLTWILKSRIGGAALITKTTVQGITITSGPNGLSEIDIDRADTQDLAAGNYVHALARTDPGLYVVLADGDVVLRKAAA